MTALANVPPPLSLECRTCGAALHVPPDQRTAICPYCASPHVVDRPPAPGRPNPAFAIGFVVGAERAKELVRAWARRQGPFRRSDLHRAQVEAIRGVYAPAYLYGAAARSAYQASIGENYTETQTYTVTVNGRTEVRTRTVTKTEWRPLAGRHATYVADVLVTASRGLENAELESLEPYDFRALRRYGPELVAGFVAEEPSLAPEAVWAMARTEAIEGMGRKLAEFMPGDHHRELAYQTQLEQESLDLLLVPVWVLALRFAADAPPLRVLVNGQTGKVIGRAPLAWPRIVAAIVLALAFVVALVLLLSRGAG